MTSLRRRLIILLVISILGVVGLATAVAVKVLGGPSPELIMGPLANQIRYMVQLVPGHARSPADAPLVISDRPADGLEDRKHTRVLNDILHHNGLDVSAVVSRHAGRPGMVASVALPDKRWMIVDVPDFGPPRDVWFGLAGWMALIVLGATPVSIYFTGVLVRPLEMLEAAASKIGSDGVLATVPEKGSAEVRATAAHARPAEDVRPDPGDRRARVDRRRRETEAEIHVRRVLEQRVVLEHVLDHDRVI